MKTVNQGVDDKISERKELLEKTWLEIITRGIESYETEEPNKEIDSPDKKPQ